MIHRGDALFVLLPTVSDFYPSHPPELSSPSEVGSPEAFSLRVGILGEDHKVKVMSLLYNKALIPLHGCLLRRAIRKNKTPIQKKRYIFKDRVNSGLEI